MYFEVETRPIEKSRGGEETISKEYWSVKTCQEREFKLDDWGQSLSSRLDIGAWDDIMHMI